MPIQIIQITGSRDPVALGNHAVDIIQGGQNIGSNILTAAIAGVPAPHQRGHLGVQPLQIGAGIRRLKGHHRDATAVEGILLFLGGILLREQQCYAQLLHRGGIVHGHDRQHPQILLGANIAPCFQVDLVSQRQNHVRQIIRQNGHPLRLGTEGDLVDRYGIIRLIGAVVNGPPAGTAGKAERQQKKRQNQRPKLFHSSYLLLKTV